MGHAIHWLKRKAAQERINAAREIGLSMGLNELRIYLTSEKFHTDTTVQVNDVLLRLNGANNLADQYEREATRIEVDAKNL